MPAVFRVQFPNKGNSIYKVPEHDLDKAISLGGEVLDDNLIKNSVDTGVVNGANSETNLTPNNNNKNMASAPIDGMPPHTAPIEHHNESASETASSPNLKVPKTYKVDFGKKGIYKVPQQDLEKARRLGGNVIQDLNYTDRLLQYGRGVAELPAVLGDLGNKYIAAPAQSLKGKATEAVGKVVGIVSPSLEESFKESAAEDYKIAEGMKNTHYTKNVHEKFNELAGKDITPRDKVGKFLNSSGNFTFPIPGTGAFGGLTVKALASQGVKESAKQVAGGLARNTTIGAGGAGLAESTVDYRNFKEGTLGRHIEDFLQTVVGMSLADKGLSAAKKTILEKTSRSLENVIEHSGQIAKSELDVLDKPSIAGKLLSLGAKPNHEINALAKKYDIQLPFEIALGGKTHQFVSNNVLKSIFTAKVYDNIILNADKDMINAVKEKIAEVSPEIVSGQLASSRASEFLQGEKSLIKEETKSLFAEAEALRKPTDTVVPTDTINTIKSMLQIPSLRAAVPGPEAKPIAKYLLDIGEKWGFIPPNNILREFEDSPDFIKKVIQSFENKAKEVPLEELIGQLQSTYQYTKHQKDIPGLKNLYNGLVKSLNEDIRKTSNKEFLTKWENANQYFKQNEVDRLRSNLASSIMKGEIPKEAFIYMDAVPEMRKLQQVIGNSEAGKQIFNELRRAKLEQVVANKIIDASGTILYGQLSNLFLRNPEQQALLKELLGDAYEGMKELAQISQEFVKSGKNFGNPSKTSFALRDMEGFKDILKIGFNAVGGAGIGVTAHGVLPGIIEGPAAIYFASKLVSNKNYINSALKYAKASEAQKITLAQRLGKIAKHIFYDEPMQYRQSFIALHKENALKEVGADEKNNSNHK